MEDNIPDEVYGVIGKMYLQLLSASNQNRDLKASLDKTKQEYQKLQELYNKVQLSATSTNV